MGRISLIKPDPQGRPNSWANFKKHSEKLIKEALLMLRTHNDLVKDVPLCFLLQHFWIDMKDCFYQEEAADRREECQSRSDQ